MTAKSTAADQPFTIVLDDDESSVAEGRLRRIEAGPTWAKHRVTLELDEGDTSGHALDAAAVSITLHFDDDVEGHALSLHFPSAQKADEFRRRVLATGIVAGALVVGVTAAQLSGTAPATTIPNVAPVAVPGPAIVQPKVNPNIPADEFVKPRVGPQVQPLVNPNIPAEDLAPAVPGTITGPLLPSSHIQSEPTTAVPGSITGPRLPSSHIQSEPTTAVPGSITGPRLPSSHIQSQKSPSTKTPAPRNRAQPQ